MSEYQWSMKAQAPYSYLAGYLDGEGCFTFAGKTIRRTKIYIACENTYQPTIRLLQKVFGGSITIFQRKKKKNWRPTYRWSVVSRDAQNVCQKLLPYLQEKAPQAHALLRFQNTMSSSSTTLIPRETIRKRKAIVLSVKKMKRRI